MTAVRLIILMIMFTAQGQSQPMDSLPESVKERLKILVPGFGAYGFNSEGGSTNANVVLSSKSAILVKYSDDFYYLLVTYDSDPMSSHFDLVRDVLAKIKVVVIKHSLQDLGPSDIYKEIPDWVRIFGDTQSVIFDNVDLRNSTILTTLKPHYLGILRGYAEDVQPLIESISYMDSLEFLMYKSVFNSKSIIELKQKCPQVITLQY